ncbi:hypothetical protein L1887_16768 [Cichorium endivia]|nr:hypothetical protein L1887_16768 [Cichorium endivia]
MQFSRVSFFLFLKIRCEKSAYQLTANRKCLKSELNAFSRFTSMAREGQWFLLIFRDKTERSRTVCRDICW